MSCFAVRGVAEVKAVVGVEIGLALGAERVIQGLASELATLRGERFDAVAGKKPVVESVEAGFAVVLVAVPVVVSMPEQFGPGVELVIEGQQEVELLLAVQAEIEGAVC